MKTASPSSLYFRVLFVSLLTIALGLSATPRAAENLLNKAWLAIQTKDYLSTSQSLAAAAEYFPWRDDLYLLAGRYASQAGNPQMAIRYLQQPQVIDYLTTGDRLILGDAYKQIGDSSTAEAIWKDVAESQKSAPAYQRLADLYLEHNDYPSLISCLKQLQLLNPADAHLYYQIGLLYAATDPSKALPYLIQAAQIDPANAAKAQDFHDRIRTATLFDDPAYTYLISGRQLGNTGEWKLAAKAFQQAIQINPGYSDAWALLGEALQQIDIQNKITRSTSGRSELEHALQLDGNSILANSLMAIYWERQQDYSQAQHYQQQAILVKPDDPHLYSGLADILSKSGDLPAAQSALEKAIQITPQDPLFYRLLAEFAIQNQIQIRELALPAARQAILLNPKDTTSLDVMAQVMILLQDYHSAERLVQEALKNDPGFTPAYLHLGVVYLYLGKPDLALKWLDMANQSGSDPSTATLAGRMLDYYFPQK